MPLLPSRVVGLVDRVTGRGRRVWATEGRAHLEVREAPPEQAARYHARLATAVGEIDEVHAATVNPHVRRLVVGFDPVWVDVADVVAVVEAVEEEFGLDGDGFRRDRPDHPGDIEPMQQEGLQLLSTAVGATATVVGRLRFGRPLRWTTDLSWAATLVENVPQLRHGVEHALGRRGSDLVLGVTNSLLRGAAFGMTGHLVDIAHRATRLRQLAALRVAWAEREPALGERALGEPAVGESGATAVPARPPREAPLPDGPVEHFVKEAWPASLGGFLAGIVATDDIERATAPLLTGIPKAVRLGRSAFVGQLVRVLAERAVLVLDDRALHVLDRVDTVVVDASLLRVVATASDEDRAAVRRFLRALRDTDLQVLVTGDLGSDDVADLVGRVGDGFEVVPDGEVDALLGHYQREGHVVLAVGRSGAAAFPRADVRVGLQPAGDPPPWDADVLCSDELADALLVVRACGTARRNSEQSVTLAAAGAGIGAATGLGGLRRESARNVLQVIDSASMLAIGNGIRLASGLAALPLRLRREEVPWHALDVADVLVRVDGRADGLTAAEWEARFVAPPPAPGTVTRVGRATGAELANPLTPVLAGGAAVSLATGSAGDAGLVATVVGLNALIGAAQRLRAEAAMAELFAAGTQYVKVRRDGQVEHRSAADLVVGDVIEIGTGEPVPADARLLSARSLEVDEASLTGESLPVAKSAAPTDATTVAERTSMIYQGTTVAAGEAVAVVVAVGADTESRRALAWSERSGGPPTGVEVRLEQLTKLTIPLALMSGAGMSVSGLLRHVPSREIVDASVGLAVAAVPEGLPLLASAAQRSAARRLSRHRILVRDPRAIEALGRIDLLCADKTGTLTQGQLHLDRVDDGRRDVALHDADDGHLRVLLAARRATPIDPSVSRLPHPTDQAVAAGTDDAGIGRANGGGFAVVDDLPFEPDRSYHAVLADTGEGRLLSVKGAPEEVLGRCTRRVGEDGRTVRLVAAQRARLMARAEELAGRGLRVLAIAERGHNGDGVRDRDVHGLTFVGYVGMRDPARPAARDAVARLRGAGIDTIMITGDHPTTALSIAAELGLDDGLLLTGPDLDDLDDDALADQLPKVTVFARVTPMHKLRIVQTAQALGRTVGMTGDGANDAPAIRLADVGIAVGERATQAARETADLIILDDRLEVIVDAIAEGRGLWGSVREAVAVLVGGNLGEISFTLLGSVFGRRPPLNTRQLLLVNLLTDVAPAMSLAIRAPRDELARLLEEGPERSLGEELSRALVWRGVGTATGATATYVFTRPTGSAARASTAGMVALVGAQLGQTMARSGGDPRVVATGAATFATMATLVQTPGLSRAVGCRPMGPVGWSAGLSGAALGTVVGLAGPAFEQRRGRAGHARFSDAVVAQLARMSPELPGLLESA